MKYLKLFNNSSERDMNILKPYKQRPLVTYTNDESKGLDFFKKSKRIATFDATDDNKLCVNSLKGFAKFIVDGEDILPKDFLESGQWESFIVDQSSFGSSKEYIGGGFSGEVYSKIKISCDTDITDNMILFGPQLIGSGGIGGSKFGIIGDLINWGDVVRIDSKTIVYVESSYYAAVVGVINPFFAILRPDGGVIPTKNEGYTFRYGKENTTAFVNTLNSLELSDDLQTALHADNMVHGVPSSWVIYPDAESISNLNSEPIFCIVIGTMALPMPLGSVFEEGLISGTEERIIVNKLLFTLLNGETGLMDFGIYLLDQDTLSVVSTYNEVKLFEVEKIFSQPYYFETNGKHEVEIEVFDDYQFNIPYITDLYNHSFDYSCISTISSDFFDGLIGLNAECTFPLLRNLTIPKECTNLDIIKANMPSLVEVDAKKGGYYKEVGENIIVKDSNGSYTFSCTNKDTLEFPIGVKTVNGYTVKAYEPNIRELIIRDEECRVESLNWFEKLTSVTLYNNVINSFSTDLDEEVKFYNYASDIDISTVNGNNVKFYGNATSDGKCLLSTNKELKYYKSNGETAYTIPDEVRIIDSKAFEDNRTLTYIVFPDGIQIEDGAFSGHTQLEAVRFNGKMKAGNNVFSGCTGLSAVAYDSLENLFLSEYGGGRSNPIYIGALLCIGSELINPVMNVPETITKINKFTFAGCDQLNVINIHDGVKEIMQSAFYETSNLREVNIGGGVETIGSHAFRGSALTSITIPENVTFIDDHAFYSCTSLQEIHLPSQIKEIGEWFFWSCRSLKNIEIPQNVEYIGYAAFYQCESLEELIIPSSVRKIDDYAFNRCTGLKTVTVNEGTSEIGQYAFYLCQSLIKVELPSTLTKIGGGFIVGALSLTEITCYATTAPVLDGLAFGTIASGGKLKVPAGSDYSSWMKNEDGYLGSYNWTIEYI